MSLLIGVGFAISIIIIEILIRNYNSIKYHIDSALGRTKLVGLITPTYIKQELLRLLSRIPNIEKLVFVDFGCSEGDIVREVSPYVRKSIGVELDPVLYARAIMRNPQNVAIYNMDMISYKFDDTDTVMYMYEPLWKVSYVEALSIYQQVFAKLRRINAENIYVIYCTGSNSQQLNIDFFRRFGFILLEKKICRYSQIIPITSRTIYMYKLQR
jgi:hypothetical protein